MQEASFDLEKLYSLYVARFESRRANYHRFISYHLSFFFFLKISPRSLANLFFSIVYTPRKRKFFIFTIASSAFLAAAAFWLFINMRPTAGGFGAYPRPHQNSSRMWGNFLSSLSLFSNFQVRSAANFCFKSEVWHSCLKLSFTCVLFLRGGESWFELVLHLSSPQTLTSKASSCAP